MLSVKGFTSFELGPFDASLESGLWVRVRRLLKKVEQIFEIANEEGQLVKRKKVRTSYDR